MIQKMLNHAQLADRFAAKIAILAVRFYQRHVSKHKDFLAPTTRLTARVVVLQLQCEF